MNRQKESSHFGVASVSETVADTLVGDYRWGWSRRKCPALVGDHRLIEDGDDKDRSTEEVWYPRVFGSEGLGEDIAIVAAVGHWPDLQGKTEPAQTVPRFDLDFEMVENPESSDYNTFRRPVVAEVPADDSHRHTHIEADQDDHSLVVSFVT